MATDKPRFSITVSDEVYEQINEYQHKHRLSTQTKAVLAFIERGIEEIKRDGTRPSTPKTDTKSVAIASVVRIHPHPPNVLPTGGAFFNS